MIVNIQDDMIKCQKMKLKDIGTSSKNILEKLLEDKTTGGHILWGTEEYGVLGVGYRKEEEMTVNTICPKGAILIKTRGRKIFEEQAGRTKKHGEVFTPISICNQMIDYLDEDFFGMKKVELSNPNIFKNTGRNIDDYIDNRRMEITCGEAPFLVQRYDSETGEIISVEKRRGIIDRKLQAISGYAKTSKEWIEKSLRALQSVYGYEFQGDNLLIARINMLWDWIEHYENRWGEKLEKTIIEKAADIIVWNLWQMDGIKKQIPWIGAKPVEIDLFHQEEKETLRHCKIKDWKKEEIIAFAKIHIKKEDIMKFDYIIGNPPYQEENKDNGRQPPVYHLFMDATYKIGNKVELITPARFLFYAGNTPKEWNKKILNDQYFKVLHYEMKSDRIFPRQDIKGGVVITYRNQSRKGESIKFWFRFKELSGILKKVKRCEMNKLYLDSIVSPRGTYRMSEQFFSDFPDASDSLGLGSGNMIVSNIFEKIPEAFSLIETKNEVLFRILGRLDNKRIYKFLLRKYIINNEYMDTYNVAMSKSNGNGEFGEVLSTPVILEVGTGVTDTFISIGKFESKKEAENLCKYIYTKFFRAMLGILKVTQDSSKSTWKYVPMQDFTDKSDIDWSKSVADIDRQLYKKYGLSQKEIDFIESHVKEMK